jgi:hypothetical protein
MTASFPGRPRVTKGALLVFGNPVPIPTQIIVFAVNPDTLTRRFDFGAGAAAQAGPATGEPTNPVTPPAEQITVTLFLDAADALEQPASNPNVVTTGLLPVIAAIEQLIYPAQLMARLTTSLANLGASTITPALRPWVVFVWGTGRVLPVKVSSLSVTEQAFDPRLNPITARAELQLTALTAAELKDAPSALQLLATVHATTREALALAYSAQSAANAPSVLPL